MKKTEKELQSLSKEDLIRAYIAMQEKALSDEEEIRLLKEKVDFLTLLHFGRKTEQESLIGTYGVQMSLFDEQDLSEKVAAIDAAVEEMKAKKEEKAETPAKRKPKIDPAMLDLEKKYVQHGEIPEGCTKIGQREVATLVRVPSYCYVRIDVYPAYKRPDGKIVRTEPEGSVLCRGLEVSPEFVASAVTDKFVMHTPLYRQEQELNRAGIPLSRMDLSNYISKFSKFAAPLHGLIREHIVSAPMVRADETTLTIIELNGKKAKTGKAKSYLWAFSAGNGTEPAIDYVVGPGRGAEVVRDYFPVLEKGKERFLQSDGYSAYRGEASQGRWTDVGCLAHIRRKFAEIIKLGDSATEGQRRSRELLDAIGAVYEADRSAREKCGCDYDALKKEREDTVRPLMEGFFAKCEAFSADVHPGSKFARALSYALDMKGSMMNMFLDGRAEIDNNYSEREAIKPLVIGRKNWLFSNTTEGAKTTCMMFSLVETAIHNGLDPYRYILWLAENLPGPAVVGFDYSRLLPWSKEVPEDIRLKKKEEASA